MKNKDLEPVEAVMSSLFRDEIKNLAVDLTDNGIDVIIESEAIQHIPVVRVINSFL